MKYRYVLVIIAAIILSAITVFGQEKDLVTKDVFMPDSVLVVKLESAVKSLQERIDKRLYEICLSDPIILKRINLIIPGDVEYMQLVGKRNVYRELIESLKPTTNNQEVKK